MTSEEFASFIEDLLTTQSNDVYFYIGGQKVFLKRSRIMHKCEFRCLLWPFHTNWQGCFSWTVIPRTNDYQRREIS